MGRMCCEGRGEVLLEGVWSGEGHEWPKEVKGLEERPQAAYPRGRAWLTVENR